MGSLAVTLVLATVHNRSHLSIILVDKEESIHRIYSCSARFNHNVSTLRHHEPLHLSRIAPTMALGHLSETLPLFSPVGVSSVESWDTMLTTVLREESRPLRGIIVTGLDSHLHSPTLHKFLTREASRTICVAGLIMYLWSKPRMTPAWYWVRFPSTLYLLQFCLIQEHHILS
jgi:hypothetical protein